MSNRDRVLAAWRTEIETILAGPGAAVADALLALVLGHVEEHTRAAVERGYLEGRSTPDAVLQKARQSGVLRFDELVLAVARIARAASTDEGAAESLVPILADVMHVQRDIDRAVLIAEAERRERAAATFPDLANAALASVELLKFAAGLVEAGLVPERAAEIVALMQAQRRIAASAEKPARPPKKRKRKAAR